VLTRTLCLRSHLKVKKVFRKSLSRLNICSVPYYFTEKLTSQKNAKKSDVPVFFLHTKISNLVQLRRCGSRIQHF